MLPRTPSTSVVRISHYNDNKESSWYVLYSNAVWPIGGLDLHMLMYMIINIERKVGSQYFLC